VIAGTGMGGGGALSADVTLNVSYGTSGTTACVGNDARLSNARTPSIHASSHTTGGSDALTLGQAQITNLTTDLAAKALGATTMTAGTGLTGGGDLSANRSFAVAYGTTSTTATVGNDSRLSFIATGTGATTRTLQNKLRDVVSVKDFGAVGDNSTDDTAAIQAALNSGSKTIYCPSGTYKTTATLYIPDQVVFYGDYRGTTIQATGVSGAAIHTRLAAFNPLIPVFNVDQVLKDIIISGTCDTGVLWTCTVGSTIERVTITATCSNGFVVDGSFNCKFTQLNTAGSTITNACFWAGRAFNANHVDGFQTATSCAVNFLADGIGLTSAPVNSPYVDVLTRTGSGVTLTGITLQRGVIGMHLKDTGYGGWTINSLYCEFVRLPVKLGGDDDGVGQTCRSVTFNSSFFLAPAIDFPGGNSVSCIDIIRANNVTFNATEFGDWGGTSPATDIIRYKFAHSIIFNGFFTSNGATNAKFVDPLVTNGSSNKIKRYTGADSDGGIMMHGEQPASFGVNAKCHFILMKNNFFNHRHTLLQLTSAGAWNSEVVEIALVT
jgi:hypothetical protein